MNCLQAVMEAVNTAINNGSMQQLADSKTTEVNIQLLNSLYQQYQTVLQRDTNSVKAAASALQNTQLSKSARSSDQAALQKAQAKYQNDQMQQQTDTNLAESNVQTSQNQTGQDSTTIQLKVQLETAINQVLQSLSSLMGQSY